MPDFIAHSWLQISRIALFAICALLTGCTEDPSASYQGYVEGEFVYLSSSESGRLDRLLVTKGQQVSAEMPLFALESANEAAVERQARQQLNVAEAQLQDLRTGKRPPELEVIRAQLSQAVANEKNSAAKLSRDKAQHKAGGIATAQLEATQAEADVNAARVRELKSQLEVASLSARDQQIQAQTANVAAARAVLDQAIWKLNQKSVTAASAGLVFDTIYHEGEWVKAGNPVIRLLPPEKVKIRFFIPEPVLGTLTIGTEVALHCDGCPTDIPAKVTFIATEAEYTPPIIYSNETRSKLVYMIEAHPLAASANLHPGQPVEVKLR